MRMKTQKLMSSKSILSKALSSTLLAGLALSLSLSTSAQPFGPSCTTTSIDVSTGLDNTGSSIPYPASGVVEDPYWTVTMVPTNTIGLTPDFCAVMVDSPTVDTTSFGSRPVSGGRYISFDPAPAVGNLGPTSGFYWTYGSSSPIGGANPTRFTRQFYIEGSTSQSVTVDINGYGDDIIFIAVDATPGTPIYNNPSYVNNVYYSASTSTTVTPMSSSVVLTLSPGMHTLDVDLYDISGQFTAISLNGTISTSSAVLAQNNCYGQNDCGDEPPMCSDDCYWRVDGNNINGSRNKLGTLSDDDIRIFTNSDQRGVITTGPAGVGSSFLGWNTVSPTSILHVDCMGNHDDGSGMSDIRFENLEHGMGNILVIDDQGHVFRTDYPIEDLINGGGDGSDDGTAYKMADINQQYEDLKTKYEALQQDLSDMSARLDALQNCCADKGTYSDVSTNNTGSALYQNTPNPFSSETTVEYYVNNMKSNAYIVLYDLNGRELNRYEIAETGKGYVTINSDKMVAGMYLYSLVIDGREIDSKKMVLSKSH